MYNRRLVKKLTNLRKKKGKGLHAGFVIAVTIFLFFLFNSAQRKSFALSQLQNKRLLSLLFNEFPVV